MPRMKLFILSLLNITIGNPIFAKCCSENFSTATPIKYIVVLYQENRTFDHYFGTYPHAQNNPGETPFIPRKRTPSINGLTEALKTINTNSAQPFRLSPEQAHTNKSDPAHDYTVLQQACDSGLMDKFVETTGLTCTPPATVMGYYDGNTVTALWNYAQHFSLSDNFRTTSICSSTVAVINLISGQAHGALPETLSYPSNPVVVEGTIINDVYPKYDTCAPFSPTFPPAELTGKNIGNLLNAKEVSWGWFHGGFADCSASHLGGNGKQVVDYVSYVNPFQYYKSTSNPHHLPPTSPCMVGRTDQANHLYDIKDFWAAAKVGNIPAVSFFKPAAYEDGHPTTSSPFLEQQFLVKTINRLQKLPQWKHMAIVIAYDDSGGWYDHVVPQLLNQSNIPSDAFVGPGSAGTAPPLGGYQGRPSYGYRVPLLLISPWAKENYVDHTLTDQTSILRFIEDNWDLGRIGDFSFDAFAGPLDNMFDFSKPPRKDRLFLNPQTGQIVK